MHNKTSLILFESCKSNIESIANITTITCNLRLMKQTANLMLGSVVVARQREATQSSRQYSEIKS